MGLNFRYFQGMAKSTKNPSAEKLVQTLQNWQTKYGLTNNLIIEKLKNDLGEKKNLKIWADAEPKDYLPMPIATNSLQRLRTQNLLTLIRNILVFAPVALTWTAISIVTSSFSKYEAANPNSIINFLEFWQQGFGYLNDFWRLSNVAIFDVLLILCVILLTGLLGYLTRKNEKLEEIEIMEIVQERLNLVLQLNEYFYPEKYPTITIINRNYLSNLRSLEKSIKSLNKILVRLEINIAKYPKSQKIISELKTINLAIKKISKK